MSKVKAIIIGVIVLLFFSMGVSLQILSRKYQAEKADKERLWNNNIELSATGRQQSALIYTKDEFIRVISDSLKAALKELKIKPTEVTKIIYRTITDIDTVDRPVYVDYRKTHWMIADTGKCFTWSGMAFLSDTILKVTRTNFNYSNGSVDYFYQSRPKKFLFIRYGKKKIRQVTVPRCGSVSEKTIEIIKE
jgi:hypothetical protein